MYKTSSVIKIFALVFLLASPAWAFLNPDLYVEKSLMQVPSELREKLQKKVDFNFKEVDLSEILILMSKIGDFNIVFPKELDKKVSIQIKQQSIQATLEDIALLYNYEFEFKSNAVVFKNMELNKQVALIPLTYLSAAKVLNILEEENFEDIKINKDPGLNNILLVGNINTINTIKKFIKKIDVAPKQKIFLPEFLTYKQVQRLLKYNIDEKTDIEVKRIDQDYILLSGKETAVEKLYKKLEEIDKPIPDQAFSIEVYGFNSTIKDQIKRLDPKYKEKQLFRVDIDELNLDSFGILNSKTLLLSNDTEIRIFDTDFKFSKDILDQDSVHLFFDQHETFFNRELDYMIYYMPKKALKENLMMKQSLELSKNIDLVFVIKAISNDDLELINSLESPEI